MLVGSAHLSPLESPLTCGNAKARTRARAPEEEHQERKEEPGHKLQDGGEYARRAQNDASPMKRAAPFIP